MTLPLFNNAISVARIVVQSKGIGKVMLNWEKETVWNTKIVYDFQNIMFAFDSTDWTRHL